jgi:hypothetical protein
VIEASEEARIEVKAKSKNMDYKNCRLYFKTKANSNTKFVSVFDEDDKIAKQVFDLLQLSVSFSFHQTSICNLIS